MSFERNNLPARCAAVLMSPVHDVLGAGPLSQWMLADRLPARLQLQLHKFIWIAHHQGGLTELRDCRFLISDWHTEQFASHATHRPHKQCER